MKKGVNRKYLPAAVAALGLTGLVLRWLLYGLAVDEKGLLVTGHPLEIALWAVTAAALALITATVWKLDGSDEYADNFAPSAPAASGHILGAAGILLTVLLNAPSAPGYIGNAWKLLGLLSAPCLVAAGFCRVLGKQPFFLLHLLPCLFLVFHVLNLFQTWSGNPQIMDYVFALFGTIVLMLFCFYTASMEVGAGKRRMQLGTGLAAVYLCMVTIPQSGYAYLYMGGVLFAVSNLCTLFPKPRPPKEESEKQNEAS